MRKLLSLMTKQELYHRTRSPKFIIDTTIELDKDSKWFSRENDSFLIWDGDENEYGVNWYVKETISYDEFIFKYSNYYVEKQKSRLYIWDKGY